MEVRLNAQQIWYYNYYNRYEIGMYCKGLLGWGMCMFSVLEGRNLQFCFICCDNFSIQLYLNEFIFTNLILQFQVQEDICCDNFSIQLYLNEFIFTNLILQFQVQEDICCIFLF
eukprot:TRINITY_DN59946_c0_g1_i1.p2 TRINITY_DN59946_c0_g1~~TRINITY_DN59946_c0_g1_i1.p2  ORF type:complete len:114 (-),score=2.87 TRINITY_DN59946_c0_g1_i1:389-730(-)